MRARQVLALLGVGAAAGLATTIGWQTDWGRSLRAPVPEVPPATPPAVSVAVLPDYRLEGGPEKLPETTARTVFVPTRRPAPPPPAPAPPEPPKPRMKKGQFVLTGTSIDGDTRIAFLKEAGSGKPYKVRVGETINELKVADVRPDRVVLAYLDESEQLRLAVAKGSAAPPPPAPAAPAAPRAAGAPVPAGTGAGAPQPGAGAQQSPVRRPTRAVPTRPAAPAGDTPAQPADGTVTDSSSRRSGTPRARPDASAAGASGTQSGTAQQPASGATWGGLYQRYIDRGATQQRSGGSN